MVLGSAAGGGLPQWNCGCVGCSTARAGGIPWRTQSSLAVSADGQAWFLVNASPDLRAQLLAHTAFHPQGGQARGTSLEGVLLTNADLDHVLGLLLLREADEPLPVHASAEVRQSLSWMDTVLQNFSGLAWHEAPTVPTPLTRRDGVGSGLAYHAFSIGPNEGGGKESVAYVIADEQSGRSLLVAPDVAWVSAELRDMLGRAAAVFWDGTFWTHDELSRLVPGKREAHAMGHLPLGEGGLQALAESRAALKVLIHINNTNPVLLPGSPERAEVESRGILVGEDGMSFEL